MLTMRVSYSDMVWGLKYLFFGVAILLFASLFLIKQPDTGRYVGLVSNVDLRKIASGEALQNPQFSGLTQTGDTIMVQAQSATPDAPRPQKIALVAPSVEINTNNGLSFFARAERGNLDIAQQVGYLSGQVELMTKQGYEIKSKSIQVNLRDGVASAVGPVIITGPIGMINAGKIELKREKDTNDSGIIYFSDGVHYRLWFDERPNAKAGQ